MPADSAFWLDLENRFRALPNSVRLTALLADGQWYVFDGPEDNREQKRLQELYQALATVGAIAAGAPNRGRVHLDQGPGRGSRRDGWLELLRDESPHFHPSHGTHEKGGIIQNLALASAEYCVVLASRAFELESVASDSGHNAPGPTPMAPAAASAPKSRLGRPEGGPIDGRKLRELREKIIPFLSQADFGDKCNPPLSEDTVQRAERGDAVHKRTADILVNVLVDLGYPRSTAEAIRGPQKPQK